MKTIIKILIGLVVIASIGFNLFVIGSKMIVDNNTAYYQKGFEKAKFDLYTTIKTQGSVLVVVDKDKSILVTEQKDESKD